jgi:hypothetical protein
MDKLTPIKKLEKIIDDLCDKGKPYKKLSLHEMRLLQELYYFEHLITFANINDQLPLHQIRAKGDLRRIKALGHQEILQQTGVEHDVTMIGHIEIRVMR